MTFGSTHMKQNGSIKDAETLVQRLERVKYTHAVQSNKELPILKSIINITILKSIINFIKNANQSNRLQHPTAMARVKKPRVLKSGRGTVKKLLAATDAKRMTAVLDKDTVSLEAQLVVMKTALVAANVSNAKMVRGIADLERDVDRQKDSVLYFGNKMLSIHMILRGQKWRPCRNVDSVNSQLKALDHAKANEVVG